MASLPKAHLTPEEYLKFERQADAKSEYIDGVVLAMAGASERHNLIVVNLIVALRAPLKAKGCRVYPSDLKVKVGNRFFYPDVFAICGETSFADDAQDIVTNPSLIIEVLSESTSGYDHGTKFLAYQQIPSLQEYLLVHQDHCLVEQYRRHPPNAWLYTRTDGKESTLETLGSQLSLDDIYDI
jgi:Uma2 family endonuclease